MSWGTVSSNPPWSCMTLSCKHFAQLLNRVQEAKITEHDETTLKARVTTLDDPDHFTDALHV